MGSNKEKDFEKIWQMYTSKRDENNYFIAIQMFKATEYTLMDFCEWLYDTYCDATNQVEFLSEFTLKLSNSNFYYVRERRLCIGQHMEGQRCYRISIRITKEWNDRSQQHRPRKDVIWGTSDEERKESILMIHKTLYFLWKY